MPSSEDTREIVVDAEGRVIAFVNGVKKRGLPNKGSVNLLHLKIGDRVSFGRIEEGLYRISVKKRQRMGKFVAGAVEIAPRFPKTSPLMKHATETFGSEEVALEWLSIECGALNNETPAGFIKKTGNEAEVERILNCIDYGMIA